MTRGLFVAVGIGCYVIFFATFLYLLAFVGGLPLVPKTIDAGVASPLGVAVAIDLALIAMFGIQHSVMARSAFKAGWTRIVPRALERSVYVLLASLVLIVLMALWRPIPGPVWTVTNPLAAALIWAVFAAGWAIVLLSTFLLNHFELFGLQQVWHNLRGRSAAAPIFRTPLFYRFVRHPLYSGFLLAFWATPAMTVGHLVFALGMSVYILVAIGHEERDLTDLFGSEYRAYRREVGMLAPGLGRSR